MLYADSVSCRCLNWQLPPRALANRSPVFAAHYATLEKNGSVGLGRAYKTVVESGMATRYITIDDNGLNWFGYSMWAAPYYAELLNEHTFLLEKSEGATFAALQAFVDICYVGTGPLTKPACAFPSASAIPEPSCGLLVLFTLAALGLRRRRPC